MDYKKVALHVRAWIEIYRCARFGRPPKCRPPCEGVDRNGLSGLQLNQNRVALHVRAWIEIWKLPH